MEKLLYKRFILVKDDFYQNPESVYAAARNATYHQPEDVTGLRSTVVYHQPGVKSKLEKILGIKITRWDTDPVLENGVFYQGFAKGSTKEIPGVHSDEPYNDITAIIYLTPGLPFTCGTSLWRHKETGVIDPATPGDARRLDRKLSSIRAQLEQESQIRSKWTEVDRIGYRFNRMVAYPSGALHSATNHYGGSIKTGRLYQTFRMGVDWSTFKMGKA